MIKLNLPNPTLKLKLTAKVASLSESPGLSQSYVKYLIRVKDKLWTIKLNSHNPTLKLKLTAKVASLSESPGLSHSYAKYLIRVEDKLWMIKLNPRWQIIMMTGFSHVQILKARAVYHANVLNYQNNILRLLHYT